MPPAAARAWPPAIAPTAEFKPKTKPATRPSATALRASAPTFACRRVCCMAASFPDLENQGSLNLEIGPRQGTGGKKQATFPGNWHIGALPGCRRLQKASYQRQPNSILHPGGIYAQAHADRWDS